MVCEIQNITTKSQQLSDRLTGKQDRLRPFYQYRAIGLCIKTCIWDSFYC